MRQRRANALSVESGFTLLETLVALVVLGFLMVGLAEGVRAGLAIRHAESRRVDQTAELDSAMRVLRGALTRLPVVPSGNRLIATEEGLGIAGEADRVSFVGRLPTGLGTDRLADMTLYRDGDRLVLAWRPHRHERPLRAPPAPTRTVLLGGIERLDLAYWGSPKGGPAAGWKARWEGTEAPELIRIRLGFAKHDRRRWPDLIVASRL